MFPLHLDPLPYFVRFLGVLALCALMMIGFPIIQPDMARETQDVMLLSFFSVTFGYKIVGMDAPRLRSMGKHPWLCLLMLVPGVNLVMQLVLLISPSRPELQEPRELPRQL